VANAELGAKCVEHAARALIALLEEVHRYPLANVRRRGPSAPT
jgi:hypothetical protein